MLFVEPLHGFTFAAVWCATVTYANRLALPGTEAKMQALINGPREAHNCILHCLPQMMRTEDVKGRQDATLDI